MIDSKSDGIQSLIKKAADTGNALVVIDSEELSKMTVKDIFSDFGDDPEDYSFNKEVFSFEKGKLESVLESNISSMDNNELIQRIFSFVDSHQIYDEDMLLELMVVLSKFYRLDVIVLELETLSNSEIEHLFNALRKGNAINLFAYFLNTPSFTVYDN